MTPGSRPAIEAVIFDLEGVIIDTEHLWDDANRSFLRRHGVVYDRTAIKPLIAGTSLVEGATTMQQALGFPGEPAVLAAERMEIIGELLRAGPGFMPGFLEFHGTLKDRYRSCVATSMDPELLGTVSQQLGLGTLFGEKLFSIGDVGYRSKPDPALFLYAAGRLGISPDRCLVIEDAPNGVLAAKNAGMRCVALASTFDETLLAKADRIVRSFAEIDIERL